MLKILLSILIFLHGAVHVWYVLLIGNVVKFSPDMGWTGKSWLLPGVAVEGFYRVAGMVLYILSALLFIFSSSGLLMNKNWYPLWMLLSAVISSIAVIFFFDGNFEMLVQKGMIGLILNIIIIVTLIIKFYS
jgi:hypothetical protein